MAVLTVSDGVAAGKREDRSGATIAEWAARHGYQVSAREVVPDETPRIAGALARWADGGAVDLILTTGGTGLAARDRTPEATRAVLEREAPGIAEALRAGAARRVPLTALSRGLPGEQEGHVEQRKVRHRRRHETGRVDHPLYRAGLQRRQHLRIVAQGFAVPGAGLEAAV